VYFVLALLSNRFWFPALPLAVLAGASFLKDLLDQLEAEPQRRVLLTRGLLLSWFALALPLCLLQSLKWGAALNAFIPLTPLLGVLFGLGVHRAMARAGTNPWPVAAGTALVAMQFALLSYQPLVPTPRDYHAQERIRTWVRAAPGEVFVSVFSSQAYLNGKAYFGDDVTLGDLARAGVESRNGLVEAVRRGQFSLLVLRPRLEPEEFADAVRERYTPVERIPMRTDIARWPYMDVYTPRDAPWHPAE